VILGAGPTVQPPMRSNVQRREAPGAPLRGAGGGKVNRPSRPLKKELRERPPRAGSWHPPAGRSAKIFGQGGDWEALKPVNRTLARS